ncbi:Phophatidylserine decarboxylase-domain-containing protein [Daedaleopsis nitida]|nr:Phophatidylserine decarboxylase-domain-containing protein [Daedaleopsis nitida]
MPADSQPNVIHHRVGGWLPKDHSALERWISKRVARIEERKEKEEIQLHPVIEEFKTFIEGDPVIFMGFHQMFEQIPNKPPYGDDATGNPQIRSYLVMLEVLNDILLEAPQFDGEHHVSLPINAILDWPMGTPAGYQMFTNKEVNQHFKKILDVWCKFLTSGDSCAVLDDSDKGWFGRVAMEAMEVDFVQTYVCDTSKPHWGFTSWDSFFTRQFRPGARPVDFPQDDVVTSACESTIVARVSGVKERDTFWIKEQPYSLADMLHSDEYVPQFVGGSVYQAFLAATKYHRWHSPVNGTIKRIVNLAGTYYAESPAMGFDPIAPNHSQAFITTMAARALIFIDAKGPVGLLCFIAVGMGDVSSCEVTVKDGQEVKKGDQLGMFHFGGSTYCLVFRPEVNLSWVDAGNDKGEVKLNAPIAKITT